MGKTLAAVIAVVVLGIIGYYIFTDQPAEPASEDVNLNVPNDIDVLDQEEDGALDSQARLSENAVVAGDQQPGETVNVNQVRLAEPGFVVVREAENGEPGEVIGISERLEAGLSENIEVALDRAAAEGEELFVQIRRDVNNNNIFDENVDVPLLGENDDPIQAALNVTADAAADADASI